MRPVVWQIKTWQSGTPPIESSGKVVIALDEILALFGFSYSKEEFYKLAEGSHDLYKDGEADGK